MSWSIQQTLRVRPLNAALPAWWFNTWYFIYLFFYGLTLSLSIPSQSNFFLNTVQFLNSAEMESSDSANYATAADGRSLWIYLIYLWRSKKIENQSPDSGAFILMFIKCLVMINHLDKMFLFISWQTEFRYLKLFFNKKQFFLLKMLFFYLLHILR